MGRIGVRRRQVRNALRHPHGRLIGTVADVRLSLFIFRTNAERAASMRCRSGRLRAGALEQPWTPRTRLSRFAVCCCATAGERDCSSET